MTNAISVWVAVGVCIHLCARVLQTAAKKNLACGIDELSHTEKSLF